MSKYIQADWPAPKNVKAFTTTLEGWSNKNLPAKSDAATHALISLFQLPSRPVWLYQTHSNVVIPADPDNINQEADASFSNQAETVCTVLTADCLPILLCDTDGKQVAAIHAGWRGLANGIIKNTLKAMQCDTSKLMAWMGPAIGPNKFEVGEDVLKAFTDSNPDTVMAFKAIKPDKWLASLYQLATLELNQLGVRQIYGGKHCTFEEGDKFYSYRRDQGQTGRLASVIWLTS